GQRLVRRLEPELLDVHRGRVTIGPDGGYATSDGGFGDRLELGDLDAGLQPTRLARVEPGRADLERRGGRGRNGGAQRLLVRAPVRARGDERREQHVAG